MGDLLKSVPADHNTLKLAINACLPIYPDSYDNCIVDYTGERENQNTYFNGWQSAMDADHRVIVTASTGNEPDGVNDATGDKACLARVLLLNETTYEAWFVIHDIELAGSAAQIDFGQDGGGMTVLAKLVFRDTVNNTAVSITSSALGADYTIKIGGCLFKDCGDDSATWRGGIYSNSAAPPNITTPVQIVNCTISGSHYNVCFLGGANAVPNSVQNCAALNAINADYTGITEVGSTALSEDDADIDDTDFEDTSSDDYRLASGSACAEAGTTESDSWFTTWCATDFAGNSWAATPACGCFEYTYGAGISIPVVQQHLFRRRR